MTINKQCKRVWTAVVVALTGMMFGTSASAQWSPADVATYVWYDASDASTLPIDSGNITQWNDKGGSGQDLTLIEYEPPQTGIRTINGLNVLDFEKARTNAIHTSGNIVAPQPTNLIAIIVASYDPETVPNNAKLINIQDRFGLCYNQIYCGKGKNGKGINVASDLSFGTQVTGTNITAAVLNWDDSAALPLSYVHAFVNGTKVGVDKDYTLPLSAARLSIMADNNRTITTDGAVAEVIITDGDTSPETLQLLEGYLAWKWGLVDKLDPTHPYKTVDPRSAPAAPGTLIYGK